MSEATGPKVTFPNGATLIGSTVYGQKANRPICQFLGVPYAQPPQRFQPTEPLELWTGERQATEFGPICPQNKAHYVRIPIPIDIPQNQSEDCLYLNIWTPKLDPKAKLPVMVWIHGGSFMFGFSNMYRGTGMCSEQDVVFLSINYRLGPFGFMTTADEVTPGNYGLMDQIEALKWVQKFISQFGGDPDNVTIFGGSAGSMSVSMLLLSEPARGLFKRGISQSGTANSPSFFHTQKWLNGWVRKQLQDTDYEKASSQALIDYLKSLPADELVSKFGDQFRPVVDGNILKGFSNELRTKKDVAPAEYIAGCNTHEVYSFLSSTIRNSGQVVDDRESATPLIEFLFPYLGEINSEEDRQKLNDAIYREYFKDVPDGDATQMLQSLQRLYCDVVFVFPLGEIAQQHSKISPTYVYKFMYRPSFCDYPAWVISDHYMEILYAIGMPMSGQTRVPFNNEEIKLSKLMTSYWANFARTGNPNGPGLPHWPTFNGTTKEYMVLNAHPASTGFMRGAKLKFWREEASKYFTVRSSS